MLLISMDKDIQQTKFDIKINENDYIVYRQYMDMFETISEMLENSF